MALFCFTVSYVDHHQKDGFSRITISANTVLAWIVGISTIAIWLGWAWLNARINDVESGKTTPMAMETRIKFQSSDAEHRHLEAEDARTEARLQAIEDRLRALEIQDHHQ